jgi:hypothetical protein
MFEPFHALSGWLALMMALVSAPLHGAVTWPVVDHYTWNFVLEDVGPRTSTTDTLSIQFDSTDRLVAPERMLIRMYGGDAAEPMYTKNWDGTPTGLNGLLVFVENWDAPLAALRGRLELVMELGSVELRRLTLSLETGTRRYATSFSPNVRLVPEPSVTLLIVIAGGFAFRRKR